MIQYSGYEEVIIMKKYILLYLSKTTAEDQMSQNMDPQQGKAVMDAWTKWYEKAGSAIVDPGTPLGKGKNITKEGMGDRKSDAAGYTIVQAESLSDVEKLVEGHPHLDMPEGSVEILECMPIPM